LVYRPVGCDECGGTGYFGRMGLVETLVVNDEIRRLILRQAESKELQRAAIEAGMVSMYDDGMRKALSGDTTVEEVLRVTRDV
jgi:general secretion pathway protein E